MPDSSQVTYENGKKSPFKKGDLGGFAFGSLCSVFKRAGEGDL
jgi:hypothetical protein